MFLKNKTVMAENAIRAGENSSKQNQQLALLRCTAEIFLSLYLQHLIFLHELPAQPAQYLPSDSLTVLLVLCWRFHLLMICCVVSAAK